MKFRFTEDDFGSTYINKKSYTRNSVKPTIEYSAEEIEQRITALSNKKVDHKKIFGYVAKVDDNIVYCKYNKDTEEFVTYQKDNGIVSNLSMKTISWREYNSNKYIDYIGEIEN